MNSKAMLSTALAGILLITKPVSANQTMLNNSIGTNNLKITTTSTVLDKNSGLVYKKVLVTKKVYAKVTVNIRKKPSINSKKVGTLKFRHSIKRIKKMKNGWSMVKYKNKNCYIKTKYLSTKKPKAKSYSNSDLNILSHLIMGESGSQSSKCQLYVGSVVLNRVKHKEFGNNIHDVVFQKGQYACTWDGNYYKTPNQQCIKNAKYLLTHGSVLPSNVVYQSQGKQGSGVYAVVDGEYFCYK